MTREVKKEEHGCHVRGEPGKPAIHRDPPRLTSTSPDLR
jgi:hypothetical protein